MGGMGMMGGMIGSPHGMAMNMMAPGAMGHAPPNWNNPFQDPAHGGCSPHGAQCDVEKPCGGGIGANASVEYDKVLGKGKFGETWLVKYNGTRCAAKVTCCPEGFRKIETDMLLKAQGPVHLRIPWSGGQNTKGNLHHH